MDNIRVDMDKALEEEMEKEKPSSDPAYWAKKSCKHCCGRGVIGTQTSKIEGNNTIVQNLLCVCARKNFRKWKEEWLAARKRKQQEEKGEAASNGNGKSKELGAVAAERLERLGDQIAILNAEIIRCDTQLDELPHRSQIAGFEETIQMLQHSITVAEEAFSSTMREAGERRTRAQELLEESRRLEKEASVQELEARSQRDRELPEIQSKIQEMTQAKGMVEKNLSRAEHQIRRRKRIIQDKLDRLEDRKYRVLKENRIEPGSETEDLTETV